MSAQEDIPNRRPNIVLMMVDDSMWTWEATFPRKTSIIYTHFLQKPAALSLASSPICGSTLAVN